MPCLKCDRPISSKYKTPRRRKGAKEQNIHETSALKVHYNITLHETLAKVIPENNEMKRSG